MVFVIYGSWTSPALAMETVYGRSCLSDGWNSSSNSPPQIDSPPQPVPVRNAHWEIVSVFEQNESVEAYSPLTAYRLDPPFAPWTLWWRDERDARCSNPIWRGRRSFPPSWDILCKTAASRNYEECVTINKEIRNTFSSLFLVARYGWL